ncbi:DivIVA domain-containing protein [Kribbella sp. CA-253562]|uniref:DivIVA domain-containing protein n=1 Tax=Kribbella sp. CA-253562 TaxID=3239942 RepID=UPI003D92FC55
MWFFGLVVVVLIGAVAVVASGRWGGMSTAYDDRPDVSVPARQALSSDDIATTRFAVALRGYRMDEVDNLLERLGREVAERDRRIADLERAVTPILHGPEGAGFTSRAEYDLSDFDDTGYQKPILVGGDFPAPDPQPEPGLPAGATADLQPELLPEPPSAPAYVDTAPQADVGADGSQSQPEPVLPPDPVLPQPEPGLPREPEPALPPEPEPEPILPPDPVLPSPDETSKDASAEQYPIREVDEYSATLDQLGTQQAAAPDPTPQTEPEPWFQHTPPPAPLGDQSEPVEDRTAPVSAEPEGAGEGSTEPETAQQDTEATDEAGTAPRGRHSAAPDVVPRQAR